MTDMLRESTDIDDKKTAADPEQVLGTTHDHDAHDHAHHPTGLKRWLLTTNHKDIGSLYLMFSFAMFLVGGAMAMVIRRSCSSRGCSWSNPISLTR